MTEDELAALADRTGKILKWAGFLLAAMLVILVIDLQLKRSIARQAVTASEMIHRGTKRLLADLMEGGDDGRQPVDPVADHGDHRGGDGSGHVDGSAGMAAGSDTPVAAEAGVPDAAPAGPRKRAPRDGGRASGPETGS